jgi:hypothetical protein
VRPELASPEAAKVTLPAAEPASPEVPPAVRLEASELPEDPPSAEVSGLDEALPESPETATVVSEAPWPEPGSTEGSTEGPEPPEPEVIMGSAVAGPVVPEVFEELFEELAAPPAPVVPEPVVELVSAEPLEALEVASELVLTAPEVPPLPELPEVAEGSEVAEPEEVSPVDPVSPELAEGSGAVVSRVP